MSSQLSEPQYLDLLNNQAYEHWGMNEYQDQVCSYAY
jgi:hypothetical protein